MQSRPLLGAGADGVAVEMVTTAEATMTAAAAAIDGVSAAASSTAAAASVTAPAASAVLAVADETASELEEVAMTASPAAGADAPSVIEQDTVTEVATPPLRCAHARLMPVCTAQLFCGRGTNLTAQTVCIAAAKTLHREHWGL